MAYTKILTSARDLGQRVGGYMDSAKQRFFPSHNFASLRVLETTLNNLS